MIFEYMDLNLEKMVKMGSDDIAWAKGKGVLIVWDSIERMEYVIEPAIEIKSIQPDRAEMYSFFKSGERVFRFENEAEINLQEMETLVACGGF